MVQKSKRKPAARVAFRAKVARFSAGLAGLHYLEVPSTQVKKLGGKFLLRLVCTVNGSLSFQCALQGLGRDGAGWIGLNKARMRELGVAEGSAVKVELKPDTSKYGLDMPEELEELLRQDEEGKRRFDLLTPGKKRNIIHHVSGPKNTDRRLDRAVTLIENLKRLEPGRETAPAILGVKMKADRL